MANDHISADGSIEVSEAVLVTFVEKVITEIKGVALSKKKKSARFSTVENGKKLDLSIEVNYGVIIPEVVKKLQREVKNNIQSMTGVNIVEVNVVVDGLNIDNLLGK